MTGQPNPSPVTHVGRYEMGAEIASGGMATVYLARVSGPSGFEKLVALKRVHPHLSKEAAFVDMFLDEARIASRIQHPNVCQVFDFGEAEGEYFIAMEFLVGETLGKLQRAVARSDFLHHERRSYLCGRLIADACEGLHAAHELRSSSGELSNVVHRDVSPQNIFITYDGHAKVVDFGIASASDRLHQTSTGTVKGKFAYMAPEQARGHKVDRRADVFALGVVLWEVLAFQRLFRRDTQAETLVALMSDEITPPSQLSPLAPPELDPVVMRALARNPADRYPTARELGRDLLRTLGRLGDICDSAEVAEWLEALFPDGRRRHEILLESARWGQERTERSDTGPVSEVVSRSSWSGVRAEEVLADAADVVLVDEPARPPRSEKTAMLEGTPAPHTAPSVLAQAQPTRSSPLRWVALAGFGLLVSSLTAVVLIVALGGSDPDPPATSAVSTTPVEARRPTTPEEHEDPEPQRPATVEQAADPEVGAAIEATQPESDPAQAQPEEQPPHRAPRRGHHARRGHAEHAAPATGTGTVVVSTPGGWANVYDSNGRFLGETPLTVTLSAGRHRLSLRPFGQPPSRSATVDVQPGQTARVSQPL